MSKSYEPLNEDEYIDLVDWDGNTTRTVHRKESLKVIREGEFICFVEAFIINPQKRVWVPRRSDRKSLFPVALI